MEVQKDWFAEPIRLDTGHILTVRADERVTRRFPYTASEVIYVGGGDLVQGVARIAQEFPYSLDHGRPFNADLRGAIPDGFTNIV